MKPRIGLMSFITPQVIWPEEQLKKAREILAKASEVLAGKGIEVIHPGEITRSHQDAYRQGLKLRRKGAGGLIIYAGFWLFSSAVVAAQDASKLPPIIWTSTSMEDAGLVGASISRGALETLGIFPELVVADFDDEEGVEKIAMFCRAASAQARMKGTTYVMFGGRALGMYTGMIDELEWRKKFGIEVESGEQMKLVSRAKMVDKNTVKRHMEWMKNHFRKVNVSNEILEKSLRLHIAIKSIMIEEEYDYCAIKCLTELPKNYVSACVAHALLNDGEDADGKFEPYVCGCECDNNGVLTMIFLNKLTGKPVCYADVRSITKDGELTLCNCGAQATKFAASPKDVIWQNQCAINGPGMASTYVCKPGQVTMARISRINGKYYMLILTGNVKEESIERIKKSGDVGGTWPHAFIDIDASYDDFLANLRSNHMHFVYGDHRGELMKLCKLLDINVIEI